MTEKKETYEPQFLVRIQETSDQKTTSFTNPHRVIIRCGDHSFTLKLRQEGLLVSTRDGFLEIQPKAGNSALLREI